MEFGDRGTLEDAVNNNAVMFDEHYIWRFICHLSSALNYLHTLKPRHVLHRDLKPANILVLNFFNTQIEQNQIIFKIADFGVAKCLNKNSKYYAQEIAGTPIYMAPEVCNVL
jgi:serine/threonine protein kinase